MRPLVELLDQWPPAPPAALRTGSATWCSGCSTYQPLQLSHAVELVVPHSLRRGVQCPSSGLTWQDVLTSAREELGLGRGAHPHWVGAVVKPLFGGVLLVGGVLASLALVASGWPAAVQALGLAIVGLGTVVCALAWLAGGRS